MKKTMFSTKELRAIVAILGIILVSYLLLHLDHWWLLLGYVGVALIMQAIGNDEPIEATDLLDYDDDDIYVKGE